MSDCKDVCARGEEGGRQGKGQSVSVRQKKRVKGRIQQSVSGGERHKGGAQGGKGVHVGEGAG